MRIIFSAVLCLASGHSLACYSPPAGQAVLAQTLLGSGRTVVLAKVRAGELLSDGSVRYDFSVEKQFSGTPTQIFSIEGSVAAEQGRDTFSHHRDERFWKVQGGRVSNDTDCKIHPDFVIGGTYLVFLEAPFTRKSFERIVRTHGNAEVKDKWLAYVEDYFSVPR